MEIDIPKRDLQSKSPSDCSIDLFSILWFYCRLWFIVSDDERIDLKESIFLLKNSHFHGGNFSSVLFVTPFHSKPVKPFLYISPILLGNIVGVDFDGGGENAVTEAWVGDNLAFIAEFYSRPKYNLHSWLLAWTGIFYFTRPHSECKGFYTPLDDQQCFLSFEINSLNRESWSQSTINFRCFYFNFNFKQRMFDTEFSHSPQLVCSSWCDPSYV